MYTLKSIILCNAFAESQNVIFGNLFDFSEPMINFLSFACCQTSRNASLVLIYVFIVLVIYTFW